MNNILRYFLVLALFSLMASGCRKAVAITTEVIAVPAQALPATPNDAAWDSVPEHPAKLLLQDLVEPRLMKASTGEVRVRAITNGSEVAFRLEWDDKTKDDLPGPARFMDACAVQAPAKLEANVPDPQMGGQGKIVEITYWRADWQAAVDGRPDSLKEIYPNASVDGYPFEAQSLEKGSAAQQEMATRYAPARALDNRRVGPRETPVEDLIADGPGSLSPAPPAGSKGKGVKSDQGWSVVITRKLPNGLTPGGRTQVAFAVWEGAHQETGSRKMRTGWIPLLMKPMKGAETK
jgi:DMSO reductase family type II enzyme heme b subunit